MKRPRLSELPFSPPQNIQVKYYGNAQMRLAQLVGRGVADEELAAAVGALDDARLEVYEANGRVLTLAHHHWLQEEQQRYLYREATGDLVVQNALFKLHEYAPPQTGLASLIRQVWGARALACKRIITFAAGDYKSCDEWIGYYVWPRLGFQAELSVLEQETLPPPLAGAQTVGDLLRRTGGQEYWFRWGFGRAMIFSLDDAQRGHQNFDSVLAGENSMTKLEPTGTPEKLAEYHQWREREIAAARQRAQREGDDPPRLTPDDEAALDRAWAILRQEEAAVAAAEPERLAA